MAYTFPEAGHRIFKSLVEEDKRGPGSQNFGGREAEEFRAAASPLDNVRSLRIQGRRNREIVEVPRFRRFRWDSTSAETIAATPRKLPIPNHRMCGPMGVLRLPAFARGRWRSHHRGRTTTAGAHPLWRRRLVPRFTSRASPAKFLNICRRVASPRLNFSDGGNFRLEPLPQQ